MMSFLVFAYSREFDLLSTKDYEDAAKKIGCSVKMVRAVAIAESHGESFRFTWKPSHPV